tara:strand:- start:22008 stop:22547 length:540 start_codon:yes stop_codon:yes gene_type:complete
MPLYEFECKKCKNQILTAHKEIEKNKGKSLPAILKKYKNIKGIQLYDLDKEKSLNSSGTREDNSIEIDLYINDGKILVLYYTDPFRFSELILDKEDEKKVKCECGCKNKDIERVISSFSYTQDLSTNPPKPPGMKDLPKGIQGKVQLGEYVEDKDKPHNIKADNRYKHQYTDKGKQKLL